MSSRSIQNLLAAYEPTIANVQQHEKIRKAIYVMSRCRTPALGSSYYRCPDGHEQKEHAHSCRHRSCSVCADKGRRDWIEQQKKRLLNTAHFHVVFTIPHEYLTLWRYNERLMTQLLFRSAQETLLQLMGDPRWHGVMPGILMALHTWGRRLNLHPHVHCVVTAGGMTTQNEWRETGEYLVPGAILRSVYRGKFQDYLKGTLKEGKLTLPPDMTERQFHDLYRSLFRKDWNVRVEERYAHGKGVAVYLARYCRGGPVHPKQLLRISHEGVVMRYLDHRSGRLREQRLSVVGFAQQLLQHVAPAGQHTIRYYGLYSAGAKRRYAVAAGQHGTIEHHEAGPQPLKQGLLLCRHCGQGYQLIGRRWQKGNSIYRRALAHRASGYVQQRDEDEIANVAFNGKVSQLRV